MRRMTLPLTSTFGGTTMAEILFVLSFLNRKQADRRGEIREFISDGGYFQDGAATAHLIGGRN